MRRYQKQQSPFEFTGQGRLVIQQGPQLQLASWGSPQRNLHSGMHPEFLVQFILIIVDSVFANSRASKAQLTFDVLMVNTIIFRFCSFFIAQVCPKQKIFKMHINNKIKKFFIMLPSKKATVKILMLRFVKSGYVYIQTHIHIE